MSVWVREVLRKEVSPKESVNRRNRVKPLKVFVCFTVCVCVAERSAWSERLVVVLVVVVAVVGVWGLLWRKRKFKIGIER